MQINEIHSGQSMPSRTLVISANPHIRTKLHQILTGAQWEVDCFEKSEDLSRLEDERIWSLVLVGENGNCKFSLDIIDRLRPHIEKERTQVVVLSETPSIDEAILYHEHGAADYRRWPLLPSDILEMANEARRQSQPLSRENENSVIKIEPEKSQSTRVMIGGSPPMLRLFHQIFKIAHSRNNSSVLIAGETGSGKEIVAHQIHQSSKCTGAFYAVNCAALVEGLFESELFGHEKGSFTGAQATKKGLWEEAANGTLFLDEITEAPLTAQTKLLRVLQEGTFRRVGGNREIPASARIIAASNRDIEKAIKEGIFREDLYYRLGEVVRVPPLRERVEDIPLLVNHFCHRAKKEMIIMPEAMEALCHQYWAGNVRELERFINRLFTFSGRRVFLEDIQRFTEPQKIRRNHLTGDFLLSLKNSYTKEDWPTMPEIRRRYVVEVYLEIGNAYRVSQMLRMDYRTVSAILNEEGLLSTKISGETATPLFP